MKIPVTLPEPTARLRRIVVVDDDPGHLQVVKIIMMREDLPCDLKLFQDPREALAHLEREPADLVIMDLAMPHLDGFETFKRLKANPATRDLPVIFLSAYKETEYMLRAFEMGAADYLSKPISSPILSARIQAILHTQDLQNELRLRNQELVQINRLKDEMLSICSHDLRSPLSAIDLICQFLKEALEGQSVHSKTVLVNRIVNQARLARRLVDNLLDLNRIEEGLLVPMPSFFKVRDLMATCTEDEAPMMQARQIELKAHLPPGDVLCFGDREMIAQVIHNILGNASKFARAVVSLEHRLHAPAGDAAGSITVSIGDDGPGIPADELPRLFEKYGKLNKAAMGSGLGLYISRIIVEQHGGTVTAQSVEGRGSTFAIELPNTFPAADLPTLEEFSDVATLVLSASKTTGLLLESVLVEAGMLRVTKEVGAGGSTPEHPLQRPAAVVVDGQAPPYEELTRLAVLLSEEEQAGLHWIIYGSESEARALHPWVRGPLSRLGYPLNPVRYLELVGAALGPRETTQRRREPRRIAERSRN